MPKSPPRISTLVLVLVNLALGSSTAHAAAARPRSEQALAQLRAGTGRWTATVSPATGTVRFLRRADAADEGAARAEKGGPSLAARAESFLADHGEVLGLADGARSLVLRAEATDEIGATHLSFDQTYRGVPVFAASLRLHFARSGALLSVNGTIVPDIDVDVAPAVAGEAARITAVGAVASREPRRAARLAAVSHRLVIYRTGLVRGVPGVSRLAWQVEVSDGGAPDRAPVAVREWVFVDAVDGAVLDRISALPDVLDRRVDRYDEDHLLWQEGDPLPFAGLGAAHDAAVNRILDATAATYDLFANLSGGAYLSYDGTSATMKSIYQGVPKERCPNASWNGTTTNYCADTAVDDTVGHEWTHAYTERTQGLVYAWQPGALNEAYSDIFGETLDLLDGSGTDAPGARRGDTCSSAVAATTAGLVTGLPPTAALGSLHAGLAVFGPQLVVPLEGVTALVENRAPHGNKLRHDGCTELTNPTQVKGKIALVERGRCLFTDKVLHAQKAGAIAAIVLDNANNLRAMGGESAAITIPSVRLPRAASNALLAAKKGARVRLSRMATADRSVRWLISEDAAGPGFAFRDMWQPHCLNDPDRVQDPVYFCAENDTDDNGGVHHNSGIPNHAYALLVDGGTFAGHEIRGIGLTRAAHVYWRAMSVYQTATSDFADHADALEQSCADLAAAGTNLADLRSGSPSGQTVRASDCEQLAAVIAAAGLREPTPCVFPTVLDPAPPPPLCPQGDERVLLAADFEDQAPGWTVETDVLWGDGESLPWELTDELAGGRSGTGFHAASVRSDDFESLVGYRTSLESPQLLVPAGSGSPLLAFDHSFTGMLRDGAQLRVSVNGGAFRLVPPEAFRFNPYNSGKYRFSGPQRFPEAPEGEPAWVGGDVGTVYSGWGTSQVDLASFAGAGDRLRVRFDFWHVRTSDRLRRDRLGWFVDDVKVVTCSAAR